MNEDDVLLKEAALSSIAVSLFVFTPTSMKPIYRSDQLYFFRLYQCGHIATELLCQATTLVSFNEDYCARCHRRHYAGR